MLACWHAAALLNLQIEWHGVVPRVSMLSIRRVNHAGRRVNDRTRTTPAYFELDYRKFSELQPPPLRMHRASVATAQPVLPASKPRST